MSCEIYTYEYKNKSANHGAQLMPIRMATLLLLFAQINKNVVNQLKKETPRVR